MYQFLIIALNIYFILDIYNFRSESPSQVFVQTVKIKYEGMKDVKPEELESTFPGYQGLRGRVSNDLNNPQFLLEKELSFLHLLKILDLYEC